MDLLTYDFMIRAMVAAVLTGLAAPVVGTYLVQRRLSLMGDGIGHIAVTGVAVGLLTGTSPTLTAVAVAALGAVAIEILRERTGGDMALALMFYGGIAGGVFLISTADRSAATLNRYLFGSIASASTTDVLVTAALTAIVVLVGIGLAPQLFAVAHDPEFALAAGLQVRAYNVVLSMLAAVTVTVAMRTVGLLLVSALMVIPVAAAQQLVRTFRATLLVAIGLGVFAALSGVIISGLRDVQPGATIVLIALGAFLLTWPIGFWRQRRAALQLPFTDEGGGHDPVPETHEHVHGPGCGHLAVDHGDHVDYIHDGHRHASHGGHYDEH